jgi:branched-chain amino acid transport system permease protein|tara:strand:+ start:326 stop:1183 length:858 start_codon:yes stop_codon:yes gene_type:complete
MEGAFQIIFNVLCYTSIMILVVLGLGVIASMMGIFNFAHGEFILLGGYTLYLFHIWGLPLWFGIVAAPFVVAIVGVVLERTIIRRFYAAPIVAMLGTYAIGVIIRETVRGLIDGLYLRVPEPLVGMFVVGDISVSKWRVAAILMTILVVTISYLLLNRTSFGLRVRASLENPELARASGISTSRIYAATFGFGAALAGLAGAIITPLMMFNADMGLRFVIQGFLAVMLGGIGTFEGSAVGGALIGAMASGLPYMVNPILADVLVFVVAIVLVKLKPSGLLSKWRA